MDFQLRKLHHASCHVVNIIPAYKIIKLVSQCFDICQDKYIFSPDSLYIPSMEGGEQPKAAFRHSQSCTPYNLFYAFPFFNIDIQIEELNYGIYS